MKKRKCPVCKKETKELGDDYWPFCSERCKLIDLGKWAKEEYRVPGPPVRAEDLPEKEDSDKEE